MEKDYDEVRLLSEKQLCTYTGLGRSKARAFGEKCGSVKRIGARVLYDKKILDKAIDEL
jgi:hypothetical protein